MKTDQVTTIARPYAVAALAQAEADRNVPEWEATLNAAASVTRDPAVSTLLSWPGVDPMQLGRFYSEVLSKMLDPARSLFFQLLAEYRRLQALPEIARLFQKMREADEKKLTVEVRSAEVLLPAYQEKLAAVLAKRFGCEVTLACETDPGLLGGVLVRAGDIVLDGSVRGKLQRMIGFVSGKSFSL